MSQSSVPSRITLLAATIFSLWAPIYDSPSQARIGLGRPIVVIGEADASPEYLFARVGGAQLSGENIAVADNGSAELRFYDSRGRFLRRTGGRGRGPGEFLQLKLVPNWHSDSIVVFDQGLNRVTFIGPDGTVGRSLQLPRPSAQPGLWGSNDVVGVARDGRLVVETNSGAAPKSYGSYRRAVTLSFSTSGTLADLAQPVIGTFRGAEFLYTGAAGSPVFSLLPFLNQFVRTLGPDRLYYVEGPAPKLIEQVLTIPGRVEHDIPFRSKIVTREEWERWFERELRTVPEARRPATRVFYRNLYAKWTSRPVAKIHVDDLRRIWVEEYSLGATRKVAVFSPDFRPIGQLEIPSTFSITFIRGGRVVGVSIDTDDVERVEVRPYTGL